MYGAAPGLDRNPGRNSLDDRGTGPLDYSQADHPGLLVRLRLATLKVWQHFLTRGTEPCRRLNCSLLALALLAFLTDNSGLHAQQPGPAPAPITFTAALTAPVFNQNTNLYEFVLSGGYTNVGAETQVRVTLRRTPLVGGNPIPEQLLVITSENPAPQGKVFGITRDPAKPQNATYTGVAQRVAKYDTTAWKYEVRICLETTGSGQIFLYKENNSEWIPLPK